MQPELYMKVEARDPNITVDSFIEMLQDTLKLLKHLESTTSEGTLRSGNDWVITNLTRTNPYGVTIGKKSVIDQETGRKAVDTLIEGLSALERNARMPSRFTNTTLTLAKNLTSNLNNGVMSFSYRTDTNKEVTPTIAVVHNINEIIKQVIPTYSEYGIVEGTLHTISSKNEKDKLILTDDVYGRDVVCNVTDKQLEDSKNYLRKRVIVTGIIHYNKNDEVTYIEVNNIKQDHLPREIGKPSRISELSLDECVEQIRGLRDGW